MTTTHPVEAAVLPIKVDAIERAEQEARRIIERYTELLAENGMDAEKVAPYPRNAYSNRYHVERGRYYLVCSLTKSIQSTHRINEPRIVQMDPAGCERFVAQSRQAAAEQYDAFVAKLIKKIGDCDAADLTGNHVWGYSVLTVTKGEAIERWKTQQIVNVSKLGKLFNQWPTRKVK